MIRSFYDTDLDNALRVHKANGLPEECFPELKIKIDGKVIDNPLFIEKHVFENGGETVMSSFLKVSSEVYLLLDHEKGTPQDRWEWLQEFCRFIQQRAFRRGFDQMTCWVPLDLEPTFRKRLEDLGFVRSPWQSYTMNIE
jgi:hypothetical protein